MRQILCRKIPLNFGLLFQNLIYIGNLSTLLQLLTLDKAYYLEIKIGLINESHQISRPSCHFGITIFEQEEEKRGIPLYQTWHIVNSIPLYHITSNSIMSYLVSYLVSHPITLSHQIASLHIISYPIVSYPTLSYHITSHQTTTYQIHRHLDHMYYRPQYKHSYRYYIGSSGTIGSTV